MKLRLNSLGSLYWFGKFTLERSRLTATLHKPIAESLESDILRHLIELPRDHNKTTLITECFAIWRILPFNEADEEAMRILGYGDEWIAWMRRIHNPGRRILTVSEIIGNAILVGNRFDWHFRENQTFRMLFPEIIPDGNCRWALESKQIKTRDRGPNGEGTFDFLGVGGALQSRHYHDITEDDTFGKDASESELVRDKTVAYHQQLIGAFDHYETGRWIYVENPWAPNDVGAWIMENQKNWAHTLHSALGGCCPAHPNGQPIFPEMFTKEGLEDIRQTQGPYLFAHQYLCLRVAPEECVFNKDWIKFYYPVTNPLNKERHNLKHEVRDGEVIGDANPNHLIRSMVVDPNHAGLEGRARHAIVVTGLDPETDRVYLLDVWAKSANYDELFDNIYRMAQLWNMSEMWLETIAAQRYLKYHIEYRNKVEKRQLRVNELKSEHTKNAKRTRIEALQPVFSQGRFWARRDQSEFLNEYYAYPGGRTVDVLDAISYSPQTWNAIHAKGIMKMLAERRNKFSSRRSVTGY